MLLALDITVDPNLSVGITWGAALISLGFVLSQVAIKWHYRRQFWLTEPERLLDEDPPKVTFLNFATCFSVIAAVGGLLSPSHWHIPLAIWIASFGAFGAAHLRWHPLRGAIGVGVLMVMFVTLGDAWIWHSGYLGEFVGALLGLGLARWLARFWEQQLDDGKPWTTAGRLIPICRKMALAMLPVVIVLGVLAFWPIKAISTSA